MSLLFYTNLSIIIIIIIIIITAEVKFWVGVQRGITRHFPGGLPPEFQNIEVAKSAF